MGRRKSPWCLGPILGPTLPYPLIPPHGAARAASRPTVNFAGSRTIAASLQERQAMRLSSEAS